MDTPSLITPARRRMPWTIPSVDVPLLAKARACFARLRERFGTGRDPAWAFSSQSEHLLAYGIWSEMLSAPEATAEDATHGEGQNP